MPVNTFANGSFEAAEVRVWQSGAWVPDPYGGLEDFEDYADDSELEGPWVTPGASFDPSLHTSDPIEGSQSCELDESQSRVTSDSITTSEGTAYSILMRFDGGVGGDPGFYTHAQDPSAPFDDQIRYRVETGGPNIGVYVREGGGYNDSGSDPITESLSTGTVYRLELLGDASSTTATATLYNHDTDTQIGQATCTYDTAWDGGTVGMEGDAVAGSQVYDSIREV